MGCLVSAVAEAHRAINRPKARAVRIPKLRVEQASDHVHTSGHDPKGNGFTTDQIGGIVGPAGDAPSRRAERRNAWGEHSETHRGSDARKDGFRFAPPILHRHIHDTNIAASFTQDRLQDQRSPQVRGNEPRNEQAGML